MTDTIGLTDRQRKRIEAIKQECKDANPHIPEPTDEQIIDSLLDTWKAVNEGYYSESENGPKFPKKNYLVARNGYGNTIIRAKADTKERAQTAAAHLMQRHVEEWNRENNAYYKE